MRYISLLLFSIFSLFASDTGGVKEANYAISAGINENESTRATAYGIHAAFPLYDALAMSLGASNTKNEGKKDDYLESDQQAFGASLFIRNASIGQLGVSYQQNIQTFDNPSGYILVDAHTNKIIDETIVVYTTRFYADLFLDDLTLGASQTQSSSDDIYVDTHRNTFTFSWYPDNNLKIAVSTSGIDAFDEAQGYTVRYQPAVLNHVVEIGAS